MPEVYQDWTNYANAMRNVYNEKIIDLKELYHPTIDLFKKSKAEIVKKGYGLGWVYPIRISGNRGSIVNISENEALGTAGKQTHDQFTVPVRITTGTIKISELVKIASEKGGGFDIDAMSDETDGIIEDIIDAVNIDVFDYGQAILGKILTTASSTTMYLTDPYGIRRVREGDVIDSIDAVQGLGTVVMNGKTISAIDEANEKITLSSNSTEFTAGHYIVRGGHQDATFPTNGRCIMGLNGIIDDGTLLTSYNGITRADVRQSQGQVMTASANRPISQLLLSQALHKASRANGGKINKTDYKIFTSEGIADAYEELLLQARIYTTGSLSGGADNENIPYKGIPVISEATHQKNQLELVNMVETMHYELQPLGFVSGYYEDTLIKTSGYLQWEGAVAWFHNLACVKPRVNVKIEKIQE